MSVPKKPLNHGEELKRIIAGYQIEISSLRKTLSEQVEKIGTVWQIVHLLQDHMGMEQSVGEPKEVLETLKNVLKKRDQQVGSGKKAMRVHSTKSKRK
jgi:hypothetical protein